MPETLIDLTGSEQRGSGHPRLAGLRPLVDMPAWGLTADPATPVPAEHQRDLLCSPWKTQERTEAPYRQLAAICSELVYPGAIGAADGPPGDVVPAVCSAGNVDGVPVVFIPFKLELPRDADWCEDPTGAALAARALGRAAELAELALLRQLWSATMEPRGTSLAAFAEDHSAAGPLDLHAAYAKLVTLAENANHVGWTLAGPAAAKAPLADLGIVTRSAEGGWVDTHDQPATFGGQVPGWAPVSDNGPGPRTAAAADGSTGYLTLTGPLWFALSDPLDALARGPQPDESLRSMVSTRSAIRGFVATRVHDVHAVLTQLV